LALIRESMAELQPVHFSVQQSNSSFTWRLVYRARWAMLALLIGGLFLASYATAEGTPSGASQDQSAAAQATPRGLEVVEHGGYPELRVDGAPFFIHSAAFFYCRIPEDLWEPMLDRYRSLGINTLDIYIPWNWHEPTEGDFDFDGHTNPRRNLRALLALVQKKGFRLIARPGPEILNEWRHGGYPGWLLERPEYKMDREDWLEGRYPPLDNLNAHDAEAAARGWLDNMTHMEHTRAWFAAVAKELAPYSSHRVVHLPSEDPHAPPHDVSGPLLFVQLGDDFGIGRTNRTGPDFWGYVEDLREMLASRGLDDPVFINPQDMRVSAAGSNLPQPIGVMGQWYMPPPTTTMATSRILDTRDASELAFFTEELKTQPSFPPIMIEYQAGWYTPADDDRPVISPPENTVLSSRLLIGNGIHGINYFPLQDTLTPAGYSVPWANHSYRWDAALSPDGDQRPRLEAVMRNARLLKRWGPLLAASHKRADFGIVYAIGAYPQEILQAADIHRISNSVMRLDRLGTLSMLSSELLDPEYQPVEQLLRDAVLLFPVIDPEKPQFQLSEKAQSTLIEYVRRGGTLVVFPARPAGKIIGQLWEAEPEPSAANTKSAIRACWKFGDGEVIESSKNFSSWIALDRSISENLDQAETRGAADTLSELVGAAGVQPSVSLAKPLVGSRELIVSEIVANEGTGLLGERKDSPGFLSVTNLDSSEPAEATLHVLPPGLSSKAKQAETILLHVVISPHESLLLPLNTPVCFEDPANNPCGEAIAYGGAEFLDAWRDGKTVKLLFYVPAQAAVRVHLTQPPGQVTFEQTTKPDVRWLPEKNELEVKLPRGAAPDFLRTVEIDLHSKPHVPEQEKAGKLVPGDLTYSLWNAARLPVSAGTFLRTDPPLVIVDTSRRPRVVFGAVNHNSGKVRDLSIAIQGPLQGSEGFRIPPNKSEVESILLSRNAKETLTIPSDFEGFLHETIELHSGADRRDIPMILLQSNEDHAIKYRFDFDRDGADEWVLENEKLRLIVSPESGGQAIALVEKSSGTNLTTSVGLLRDGFSETENPSGIKESRARGRYGLFNRPYDAVWQTDHGNPALTLHYEAPDILPAGASIRKTVQFEGTTALRIDYRIALNAFKGDASAPPKAGSQSFIALNSFPALAQSGETTRFCWSAARNAGKIASADKSEDPPESTDRCEVFRPGGETIQVPVGTTRIEVRTPDWAGIAIEWQCANLCAQMTIEPKNFSALFRLAFPPLAPGADASDYAVRFRTLDVP
jgi:hypothetical protein